MRISDWSSDVCSSDLWRNSRQRGGFWTYSEPFKVEFAGSRNPRVRRMLLRFIRRNRGLFRDPCGTRYLSKSSCDRSAGRGHIQIGRASCREGVGPYVEILVVAVSLKKKS